MFPELGEDDEIGALHRVLNAISHLAQIDFLGARTHVRVRVIERDHARRAIGLGGAHDFGDAVSRADIAGVDPQARGARLGGLEGRSLRVGDIIPLTGRGVAGPVPTLGLVAPESGPIRVTWGLHADLFPQALRQLFVEAGFVISSRLDRMGVRLDDPDRVFADAAILSLASDAIVPGDIQILGDGTPIVLMRDHQPTGGYPRIATVITVDLDRLAQLRPGTAVAFAPVTVEHAHALLRSRQT